MQCFDPKTLPPTLLFYQNLLGDTMHWDVGSSDQSMNTYMKGPPLPLNAHTLSIHTHGVTQTQIHSYYTPNGTEAHRQLQCETTAGTLHFE